MATRLKQGGGWGRRKEEASLEVLSTGSEECEKVDGSGRRRHTSQFSNIRIGRTLLSEQPAGAKRSESTGHSWLTLKDTV